MLANMTDSLDFQSKALVLRAERQRVIASNIANADTTGYVGRDLDFKASLSAAVGDNTTSLSLQAPSEGLSNGMSHKGHIPLQASTSSLGGSGLGYSVQSQPAMDGNSVNMDQERANFVDNSVRYEATLRFINGQSKTLLSAIQGQ